LASCVAVFTGSTLADAGAQYATAATIASTTVFLVILTAPSSDGLRYPGKLPARDRSGKFL
jgi:hypothetical protein